MSKFDLNRRIEFGEVRLSDKAKARVNAVMDRNWISMGQEVELFEQEWRGLFNYSYARAMSSGTAAGTAACMVLYDFGAKAGDEIITTGLSFIATANSIRAAGFRPVFVDVNMDDMNIDYTKIEKYITDNTVAIKVVNLMGVPANLPAIKEIADKHGLKVIIDDCEAYSSTINGFFSLEYGDMATASFFTAHLCCIGEGGMVSTKHEDMDIALQSIRSHGRVGGSAYFDHVRFGLNFKNTDLHCAIGVEEVRMFWDTVNRRRANIAKIYNAVAKYSHLAYFTTEKDGTENAPHAFSIVIKSDAKRANIRGLQEVLDRANIAWKRNFGCMPHHKAFNYPCYLPNAEYIGNNGLHIGCHKYLTDNDLDRITETLTGYFKKCL